MSRHEGVSCDSCLKSNFTGKRYKCLICYDYDLCSACYEAGVASTTRHSADHPMQCILTRSDFDLYFGGEPVSADQHQSYTCPHCGRMGFTDLQLLEHVSNDHADATAEVVCPVCAAYPGGEPNHVIDDLAAHLMLEHRTSNSDIDVQLSGMRAVRRIPHHGRSVANTRTRRTTNMQYQTPGSTLMVLSPGDRDREAMDPIAELLSQLSNVRSRTAAAQSISTQLQQLEMQLHSSSSRTSAASRLQPERLAPGQSSSTTSTPDPRAVTTIAFPSSSAPLAEQQVSTAATVASAGHNNNSRDRSAFLLSRLGDTKKSESELQTVETERADKSMFVQELILALLADGADQNHTDYKDLLVPLLAQNDNQSKAEDSASSANSLQKAHSNTPYVSQQDHHQPQKNSAVAASENNAVHDHLVAAAAVSHVGSRTHAYTTTPAPTADSKTVSHTATSSVGPRAAVAKRKSVPTANTSKTGKEASSLATNASSKRH